MSLKVINSIFFRQDSDGDTPLHLALRRDQEALAFALIERSPNLHISNKNGRTVLMHAACRGYRKIVEVYTRVQNNVYE